MNNKSWVLIDTETTGLTAPIFVVELGAQKMRGWEPDGSPFRRLLNQNLDIPPESSRVHGYTREILERDGDSAINVYRDFATYAGGLPIVAFNLEYDLDEVLFPEWQRLGIKPIGSAGFCAYRLAQRLLDPIPSGNCKLQTLRQYYRLPERGAHTALGDVETVVDLLDKVLRPIAQQRELNSWDEICAYQATEWYPSRLAFGKFKGCHFQDARTDAALRGWLDWLAGSTNVRNARMGQWYLERLVDPEASDAVGATAAMDTARQDSLSASTSSDIVRFVDPQIDQLRQLVTAARSHLAEIESSYMKDRQAVDMMQATIFKLVCSQYQSLERLKLVIEYRSKYLKALLASGEEYAAQVEQDYIHAKNESDESYHETEIAAANRKELSDDEAVELKTLWKKLVRLYHPDRFANQPDKLETYYHLTSAINQARENGDVDLLREIANDPHGFILRAGWASLDFDDVDKVDSLRRLLDTLQLEIMTTLDLLNDLHESSEFTLYQLSVKKPSLLKEVAKTQVKAIEEEIAKLQLKAEQLKVDIDELLDDAGTTII